MCPLKNCTTVVIRLVSAYKKFHFLAVCAQKELLGAPMFASIAAQTHLCWEPDVPGQQKSSKYQTFRNRETPRKPEEKEAR